MSCSGDHLQLQHLSTKLTAEVLESSLHEVFGTEAEFISYKIIEGAAKGDSYLSDVRRIHVEGKSNSGGELFLPLIIKCLPKSIGRRKTFRSVEFFQNEVAFYNTVVPSFIKFQNKQNPKRPFTEFPRCFFAFADGENDIVVMEDVSYKGFKTASRQDGLTFEQCEVILNVMGRFHALSLAMKDKDPTEFSKAANSLKETYYRADLIPWYMEQLRLFTDIALDAVSKELPEEMYIEKLQQFTDNSLYERMIEYVKPVEPYAVIGHGDAWAPNFLIKGSNEGSENMGEICIIDYQLARYASPVLDISFFLYSCAASDVLLGKFDDILKSYYKSVQDFIVDLGSSGETLFPYDGFQREVISYFAFGLGMSLESVPLSILDEEDLPDVESLNGDEAVSLTKIWALKPIKNKEGRLRLAYNVKHAVDRRLI